MAIEEKLVVAGGNLGIFHLFPYLPAEIRLEIWNHNLPGPRIVEIKCTRSATIFEPQYGGKPTPICTSASPIPINLHTCRESRLEGLKRYRLLFDIGPQAGRFFFDPLRDTLYFGARDGAEASETQLDTLISLSSPEELALVRHVAINEALMPSDGGRNGAAGGAGARSAERILRQVNQHFVGLEQLTFVCDDRNPVYSADAAFVEPGRRNRLLERRIQTAITAVERRQHHFKSPRWRVQTIAAEPDLPVYDQEILGYQGRRSSFFKRARLPQYSKLLAN
ncbi:hypothetical protein GGS23DRAFT_4210 [Durotheca rogersii]|uniref:uncharacterized protein n=1 Tax=Durotheca rogersii TaxID=419775 RepID=UPI0022201A68|nr:uncharacterized protein GGS23DRAFT_4210 [Durotheca rogersii]KAI5867957.1 hypothetical protein GGS23DRAFT_4210 [Durotheca rogersii]